MHVLQDLTNILTTVVDGFRAAPIKIGSDNPDNLYQQATLSSSNVYLVSGTRGSVNYLGFGTQKGQYGRAGGLQTVGYMDASELYISADGCFEIILSVDKPAGKEERVNKKKNGRISMITPIVVGYIRM